MPGVLFKPFYSLLQKKTPARMGNFSVLSFLLVIFISVEIEKTIVFGNSINSFLRNPKDLRASNPYNLQTETLSWEAIPTLCMKRCRESKQALDRRLIRFDKQSGKCECFLNMEENFVVYDSSTIPTIPEKLIVFYTGKASCEQLVQ